MSAAVSAMPPAAAVAPNAPSNGAANNVDIGCTAREVTSHYDRWAPYYDTCYNRVRDLDALVLRSQGFDLAWKSVVEFGCGTGRHTEWFLRQHGKDMLKYTAMDASKGMLQTAKDRVLQSPDMDLSAKSKSSFVFHDLTKPWPMPSNSVDLVFGNLVLDHIENLDFFFREAARILRPGGNLFICELHPFKQYLGIKARYDGCPTGEVAPPCFTHDLSDFTKGGKNAGLSVADIGDWRDEGLEYDRETPPRLLSVLFKKD